MDTSNDDGSVETSFPPNQAPISFERSSPHCCDRDDVGDERGGRNPFCCKDALALRPVQKDAVFETVPTDQTSSCKVTDVDSDRIGGWEVTSSEGVVLRRFLDTNGDKRIDLWSYYNFGVEAYRDIDSDFNGKADQYRWLGNTGTRWGIDKDEDGRIDRWKRISAEEVSAEIVAAVRDADVNRFINLLITPSELESLGLGSDKASEIDRRAKRAAAGFRDFAGKQKAIDQSAQWLQFAAPAPGLLPAGTDGSTDDIVVYENVVSMYEQDGKSNQLAVGTLVQVGETWRIIGLPNIASDQTLTASTGVFFTPASVAAARIPAGSAPEMEKLYEQLDELDIQLSKASDSEAAKLHQARVAVVQKLIQNSDSAENRTNWTRQLIDTVSVAVQGGRFPEGLKLLAEIPARYARGNQQLAAYAKYQTIQAEYVVRQTPDADFEKVQQWYLSSLQSFVADYPKSDEAAQAMLQLALSKEFEDKEKDALALYRKVRDAFKGTESGEKAAGAVRRLESVGRRIELEGKTVDGKTFKLSAMRGRPVVVHYWATWCEPCKQDMKLLNRLAQRYKRAGLTLVGVNVDASRGDAEGFLKTNRLPWIQLFEDGGLESSPLSKAFGVQTLPTMMLIDKKGIVVRHNVRAAELDAELDKMLK